MKELREDGYEIYYLYESYINEHHVFEKEWQSLDIKRNVPSGKGKRLIMAHCGSSEKGLVQNGELIFKSKSNDEHGDYHKDMDSIEFNRWIKTQIIPSFTKKNHALFWTTLPIKMSPTKKIKFQHENKK